MKFGFLAKFGYSAVFMLSLAIPQAYGDADFYTDFGAFSLNAGQLAKESFEAEFPDAASVQFDGFTATEFSTASLIKSRTDYVSDGSRSMGFTWNGDGYFELAFEQPIWDFGANILDFGTCCGATELSVVDDTGTISAMAAVGENPLRGNVQFFGIVSDTPFQSLRFTSNQVSDNDLIIFDELQFTATPEPTGIFCCLLGLSTTALFRKRLSSR